MRATEDLITTVAFTNESFNDPDYVKEHKLGQNVYGFPGNQGKKFRLLGNGGNKHWEWGKKRQREGGELGFQSPVESPTIKQ